VPFTNFSHVERIFRRVSRASTNRGNAAPANGEFGNVLAGCWGLFPTIFGSRFLSYGLTTAQKSWYRDARSSLVAAETLRSGKLRICFPKLSALKGFFPSGVLGENWKARPVLRDVAHSKLIKPPPELLRRSDGVFRLHLKARFCRVASEP